MEGKSQRSRPNFLYLYLSNHLAVEKRVKPHVWYMKVMRVHRSGSSDCFHSAHRNESEDILSALSNACKYKDTSCIEKTAHHYSIGKVDASYLPLINVSSSFRREMS